MTPHRGPDAQHGHVPVHSPLPGGSRVPLAGESRGALAVPPRCHQPPLPFPFLPSQVLSSRARRCGAPVPRAVPKRLFRSSPAQASPAMDASGALASAPSSAAPSGSRSPMFPPGADREEWGPRFNCAPSTSAAASQAMPASGRKRKANFSNDETETLVWNVVRHFSALYGSEALRAHPVRRKQLWTQIQSRVNFLGYTERSIDDLKHKWRDLRLDVKKKITSKKHLPMNRAGGPLHKPRLTPLEKMVASTFLQASHDSEPEIILDPGRWWRFCGRGWLGRWLRSLRDVWKCWCSDLTVVDCGERLWGLCWDCSRVMVLLYPSATHQELHVLGLEILCGNNLRSASCGNPRVV